MQLVAYGAQDVYLTGNPQITFWKVVYRRHTNFAMEAVQQTLNGNPNFGRQSSVTILRNGDLAGRTCLRVELAAVNLSNKSTVNCTDVNKVAYVRRLGHALIKEIDVEIGGSRMDRHYGVWMDIWWELTHTFDKERGYRAMIGDVEELTRLRSSDADDDTVAGSVAELPAYTLYIPLQFWFNRNPGLALPLIALQYHEVRLNMTFERIENLVVWAGASQPDFSQFQMADASILVDYIYLDSEERRRFAQVGHEYLIEQLQFTGTESVTGSNTKLKLGFNHPCKELIWALRNGAYNGSTQKTNGNRFLAYTHDDAKWESESGSALQDAADNLARGMVYINQAEPEGAKPVHVPAEGTSQSTLVTFSSGVTVCVNVVVSECVSYGSSGCTSGSVSVFYLAETVLKNAQLSAGKNTSNVKSLGANKIHEITVSIDLGADCSVDCWGARADEHTLTLGDISVPVSAYEEDYRSTTTTSGVNPYDVAVVQLNNYGLRLDGRGNPVQLANIQLNGHDRYDPLDGNYHNYVQPDAHHTRTPADGINVYSFALHPEQHQPSGSANLSRIDNTQLNILFGDSIRSTQEIPLDIYTGSLLYVYAVNYNVLRIMSGMGGLAYAN